jgi:hypothetical protein
MALWCHNCGSLSFIVCRGWPNKAAMWVWVLPVLFLAFRVLLYATNKSDNSIWEHFFAPSVPKTAHRILLVLLDLARAEVIRDRNRPCPFIQLQVDK